MTAVAGKHMAYVAIGSVSADSRQQMVTETGILWKVPVTFHGSQNALGGAFRENMIQE